MSIKILLVIAIAALAHSCFFGDPVKNRPGDAHNISIDIAGDFNGKLLRVVTFDATQTTTPDPATGLPYGPVVTQAIKDCSRNSSYNKTIKDERAFFITIDTKTAIKNYVFAYIDLNGNGLLDQNEPYGIGDSNPVGMGETGGQVSINKLYSANRYTQ